MTPADLTAWRQRLGLTKADAARALQTPYRTYQDWERGIASPPACLRLACRWVESVRKPAGRT